MNATNSKWVIANWKMNPVSQKAAANLAYEIGVHLASFSPDRFINQELAKQNWAHIILAPSFIHLLAVQQQIASQNMQPLLKLAAQNICGQQAEKGAFTGEVSAAQLAEMGIGAVIVGHSERRQYFAENDDLLAKKIANAFAYDLQVIFCIGESHEQYLAKQTFAVLAKQLEVLAQFTLNIPKTNQTSNFTPKLLVAYEPIWAIGTGLTPTLFEIEQVHNFISETLSAMQVYAPILYGGSVNAKNAAELATVPLVDGVLVGGAALDADSFWQIIVAFS